MGLRSTAGQEYFGAGEYFGLQWVEVWMNYMTDMQELEALTDRKSTLDMICGVSRKESSIHLDRVACVIVIISILASLLLPAMSRAKDSGRTTHCMNNQKQIGFAILMYSGDDVYPTNGTNSWSTPYGGVSWDDLLSCPDPAHLAILASHATLPTPVGLSFSLPCGIERPPWCGLQASRVRETSRRSNPNHLVVAEDTSCCSDR